MSHSQGGGIGLLARLGGYSAGFLPQTTGVSEL